MTTLVAALLIAAVAQAPPSAAAVEATRSSSSTSRRSSWARSSFGPPRPSRRSSLHASASSVMVEGREPEVLDPLEWLRLTNAHARLEGFEIRSVAAGTSGDHAFVRVQVARRGFVGSGT